MKSRSGKTRKVVWISSLGAVVVLGILIGMISFSTFSGSSGAATEGDDPVAEKPEAPPAENGEEDTGEGEVRKAEGKESDADPGLEEGEAGEGEDEKKEEDRVPVEVAAVESRAISSYLTTTANLEAENHAQVLAEIEGLVVKILVEEGDRVQEGQVLAHLDEGDKAIRVRKADLKFRNERANFERAQRMVESNLISQEEFDKLKFAADVARQEMEEAEYLLSRTEIRAPFAGTVSERFVKPGVRVKPSDPMFSLVSYEPLVAKIFLPEKDIQDVRRGDEVLLTLNAVNGRRFPGRISLISPVVDPGTGTVKVTVEVPRIPDYVRPGSFVTVNIVRETHDQALTVPREAVVRELQENFVYVVEGEEAKKRDVELGFEENGLVEILSGLSSGERIVTVGQGGLKDGTKIEIIDT